jgi:glycosyltransferase involved in cell wall biosynthesis
MSGFLLTPYPVPAAYRARLEERFGPLEPLTIADLRRLSLPSLVRTLRALDGTGVVAAESESARALLPMLQSLAAVTRAQSLYVVVGDAAPSGTARRGALTALPAVAAASIAGLAAVEATRRDARRLLAQPRAAAVPDLARGLVHLNAAPWLGLTAGGSIAHTTGVANALADEGIDVTVCGYGDVVGLRDRVRVERLRPPRGYALPADTNRYRFARAASMQVAGHLRAGAVYDRLGLGSVAGADVARRLDVPLVVEYNGSEIWAAQNWDGRPRWEQVAQLAEDASLRHARLVVTVSETLRDELLARGVEDERIVCHPNGVDPDRLDPARFDAAARSSLRARYDIPADALLVSFVGTFGRWHGAEVLARAAVELASADIYFLFVGDGHRAQEVAEILTAAGSRAVLAGLVPPDEIPLHLAASDVLVSPHIPNADGSRFFGSPTKLFEYMAAGKAIVASDLDQIGEVLANGAAVLVEPGSVESLARAVGELAGDPERRATLGRAARERVLARYTWRHHVRAILDRLG